MRLSDCATRAAWTWPDCLATSYLGRSRIWQQAAEDTGRLAAGLRSLGVLPGDRIAILSENFDRYFDAFFAASWLGAARVRLHQAYGQTEASPILTLLGPEQHAPAPEGKACSAGLPVPGCEVAILDPEAGSQLPCGQIGEICGRGDNVRRGYWGRPDLTERALRAGWLHTGDAGYLDEMVKYFRERLAGFKCPRTFEVRAVLPKTGAGKIAKKQLTASVALA